MTRSELSKKFLQKRVNDFIKKFRDDYKKENGKPFKGNVLKEITMGPIRTKGVPEPEDTILLCKLGNPTNCTEDDILDILTTWVQEHPDRGWLGAHCELSKDFLVIDHPLDAVTTDQIKNMENTVIEKQKAIIEINKAIEELTKTNTTDKESADKNK